MARSHQPRIRKGDRVQVLAGKDRGKTGDVLVALPDRNKVIVEGVNVAKRHRKSRSATDQGGILDIEMPIDASNVGLVCSSCGKPVRAGMRFEPDGTKVRICRSCGGDL
jgi:large subunit ribosomal protein L24